ncbi:short chain dehydrogenase/reductase [Melanomma pulvis-pyrius CBS 109.77]|uniref:Short chain dehydrogenase/reductase n=1 Tax=Melanomma pulvis-pyrius CBS 109.77 TaxID=1314802 RepID=A0A6A6X1X8_9PLEO|nr:short chain dehydrogenase/reductase [Melanomma pulvis-pyrius CBS 109.77]
MSVFRKGSTALITGGASGIGLAVAQLCLKQGMRVVVVDLNTTTLELARKTLDGGDDVAIYTADVAKEEDWKGLKGEVGRKFGDVDFLMLNAGVGTRGTWGDSDYFQKIFSTNLFGVVNGLNTFVPSFQARSPASNPSAIVITGSKQGITNPPGNAAYNASKAAVKSLAEHLSFDLKGNSTSVHLLVPGWTFTGLSGNAPGSQATKPSGAWHASQVVDYMYQKMQDGKFYIICPDDDVSETTDKKRMLWSAGDVVNGRPPLTRWRPEYKDEAEKWMAECDV